MEESKSKPPVDWHRRISTTAILALVLSSGQLILSLLKSGDLHLLSPETIRLFSMPCPPDEKDSQYVEFIVPLQIIDTGGNRRSAFVRRERMVLTLWKEGNPLHNRKFQYRISENVATYANGKTADDFKCDAPDREYNQFIDLTIVELLNSPRVVPGGSGLDRKVRIAPNNTAV